MPSAASDAAAVIGCDTTAAGFSCTTTVSVIPPSSRYACWRSTIRALCNNAMACAPVARGFALLAFSSQRETKGERMKEHCARRAATRRAGVVLCAALLFAAPGAACAQRAPVTIPPATQIIPPLAPSTPAPAGLQPAPAGLQPAPAGLQPA